MNLFSLDFLSMIVVGALWGCTNPLLRKGSVEATSSSSSSPSTDPKNHISNKEASDSFLASFLKSFIDIKVWLPYVLNQSGSLVFYILLAKSDISTAVPICNAMALLFSFATSSVLGETTKNPLRTALGASLILFGVTVCVSSQEQLKTVWTIDRVCVGHRLPTLRGGNRCAKPHSARRVRFYGIRHAMGIFHFASANSIRSHTYRAILCRCRCSMIDASQRFVSTDANWRLS